MISRLTALAATFAVLATASIAFAASAHQGALEAAAASAKPVRIVQLDTVTVVAKRLPQAAR
jgi:ABC-type proline/glycine betaine transport system substrate-binding protein